MKRWPIFLELFDFGLYPSSKKILKIRNSVFTIELRSYISRRGRSAEVKEIFKKDTILRSHADVVVL